MLGLEVWLRDINVAEASQGGLFLESSVPASFVSLILPKNDEISSNSYCTSSSNNTPSRILKNPVVFRGFWRKEKSATIFSDGFLSVSLSVKGSDGLVHHESNGILRQNGEKTSEEIVPELEDSKEEKKVGYRGKHAMNTTKHLWAGAVAAMVSRSFDNTIQSPQTLGSRKYSLSLNKRVISQMKKQRKPSKAQMMFDYKFLLV